VNGTVYHPFGELSEWLTSPALTEETKGFIGERFDEDSGLQYLTHRTTTHFLTQIFLGSLGLADGLAQGVKQN